MNGQEKGGFGDGQQGESARRAFCQELPRDVGGRDNPVNGLEACTVSQIGNETATRIPTFERERAHTNIPKPNFFVRD